MSMSIAFGCWPGCGDMKGGDEVVVETGVGWGEEVEVGFEEEDVGSRSIAAGVDGVRRVQARKWTRDLWTHKVSESFYDAISF